MDKIFGLAIVIGIIPRFEFNSFSFQIDTDSGGLYNLLLLVRVKLLDRYTIYRDLKKLNQLNTLTQVDYDEQ